MANLNLTQEKLAALRSEYKHRNVRGKYPRQKMLPEYRCLYPWVLPDETDPYYTFCTVCECRLSAKRSDLGKHEGSIKHTENATKKGLGIVDRSGLVIKGSHTQPHISIESSDSNAEITVTDDDEEEEREQEDFMDGGIYIKHEPVVDLIETSSNLLKFDELNAYNQDSRSQRPTDYVDEDEESDADDGNDNENEDGDESLTPPPAKRATSESDSQSHHVNVSRQRFSIRKVATQADVSNTSKSMPTVASAQAPCKITIKKITAPITQTLQTAPLQATPMGTTITSVPAAISISKQQSLAMPIMSSSPAVTCSPSTLQMATALPVRDSFDLFFDSICATVKTLPPKLATESKVRVMQLIGELEIRAITERESSQSRATGQQNSTVASTTK